MLAKRRKELQKVNPFEAQTRFMFASGIENSYPLITLPDGKKFRVDEMESTGHYKRWKEDLHLAKELGIGALRYGPPYYRTHLGPDKFDWSFTDDAFDELRYINLLPIADLCHFGVPDWIESFQNPDFPKYFAEYASAFARRFPWVQYYTPVNEIFVTAMFSGQYGWWNEQLTSDEGFVTALKHLCMANLLAMKAILEVRPDAVFVQSESSEYFHAGDPGAIDVANFLNEKRFLALDLTYGNPINAAMFEFLLDHGMSRKEYHWFAENQVRARFIMGNDYYVTNEHLVNDDGTTAPSGEIFGYYVITHQYYSRYRLPVMHTETNIREPDCVDWLWKEWSNVHRLRQDGVPIVGFTWYSVIDQVDWDTALREKNGHVDPLGLYDIDRKIRPVGRAYKKLIEQWGPVLPLEALHPHSRYY
jgi:beta-glucosidase/6-phospho-beta-glucosidase/beta-galactosidase